MKKPNRIRKNSRAIASPEQAILRSGRARKIPSRNSVERVIGRGKHCLKQIEQLIKARDEGTWHKLSFVRKLRLKRAAERKNNEASPCNETAVALNSAIEGLASSASILSDLANCRDSVQSIIDGILKFEVPPMARETARSAVRLIDRAHQLEKTYWRIRLLGCPRTSSTPGKKNNGPHVRQHEPA